MVHNDGTRDTRHLHRTARMFVHKYSHTQTVPVRVLHVRLHVPAIRKGRASARPCSMCEECRNMIPSSIIDLRACVCMWYMCIEHTMYVTVCAEAAFSHDTKSGSYGYEVSLRCLIKSSSGNSRRPSDASSRSASSSCGTGRVRNCRWKSPRFFAGFCVT